LTRIAETLEYGCDLRWKEKEDYTKGWLKEEKRVKVRVCRGEERV